MVGKKSSSAKDATFRVVMLNAPTNLKHKEAVMPIKELDMTAGLKRNLQDGLSWAPVCTWYTLGNCRNGAECRYIHPKWALIQKFGWVGIAPHCEPEVRERILARTGDALHDGPPSAPASPTSTTMQGASQPTSTATTVMKPMTAEDQLLSVLRRLRDEKGQAEPTKSDVALEWVSRFAMKDRAVRTAAIDEAIAAGRIVSVGAGSDMRLKLTETAPSSAAAATPGGSPSAEEAALKAFRQRLATYFAKYDPKRVADVGKLATANAQREAAFMRELCARYGPEDENDLKPKTASAGPTKSAWGTPQAAAGGGDAVAPVDAGAKNVFAAPAAPAGTWGKTSVWGGATSAAAARAALEDAPALAFTEPLPPVRTQAAPVPAALVAAAAAKTQPAATTKPSQSSQKAAAPASSAKAPSSAAVSQNRSPQQAASVETPVNTAAAVNEEIRPSAEEADDVAALASENATDATANNLHFNLDADSAAQTHHRNAEVFETAAATTSEDAVDVRSMIGAFAAPTERTAASVQPTSLGGWDLAITHSGNAVSSANVPRSGSNIFEGFAGGTPNSGSTPVSQTAPGQLPAHSQMHHHNGGFGPLMSTEDVLRPTNPWAFASAAGSPAAPVAVETPSGKSHSAVPTHGSVISGAFNDTSLFGSPPPAGAAANGVSSRSGSAVASPSRHDSTPFSSVFFETATPGVDAATLLRQLAALPNCGANFSRKACLRPKAAPRPSVVCGLCNAPMVEPVEAQPCRHTFCRQCLKERATVTPSSIPVLCVKCIPSAPVASVVKAAAVVVELLDELPTECAECGWLGARSEADGHKCSPPQKRLEEVYTRAREELRATGDHAAAAKTCNDTIVHESVEVLRRPDLADVVVKLLLLEAEANILRRSPRPEQLRRAIEAAENAKTLAPGAAQPWLWLGRAHEAAGNAVEAVLSYQECLKRDSSLTEADERIQAIRKQQTPTPVSGGSTTKQSPPQRPGDPPTYHTAHNTPGGRPAMHGFAPPPPVGHTMLSPSAGAFHPRRQQLAPPPAAGEYLPSQRPHSAAYSQHQQHHHHNAAAAAARFGAVPGFAPHHHHHHHHAPYVSAPPGAGWPRGGGGGGGGMPPHGGNGMYGGGGMPPHHHHHHHYGGPAGMHHQQHPQHPQHHHHHHHMGHKGNMMMGPPGPHYGSGDGMLEFRPNVVNAGR